MNEIKQVHKTIGLKKTIYHFKSENADIDFNDFSNAETLYNT